MNDREAQLRKHLLELARRGALSVDHMKELLIRLLEGRDLSW